MGFIPPSDKVRRCSIEQAFFSVPNAETDKEKEPRNPEGVEAPHTWGSSQCDAASVFRLRRCFDPATCGNSSISLCLIATHGGNTCSVLLCSKSIRRCE